jgi:hypothetical protein
MSEYLLDPLAEPMSEEVVIIRDAIAKLCEITFWKNNVLWQFRPHILWRSKGKATFLGGIVPQFGWHEINLKDLSGVRLTNDRFQPDLPVRPPELPTDEILCCAEPINVAKKLH